ncbi:DUF58 domain-containing protein [Vagococcus sp.]|uniref:DUF58 domain-containing protein n=1 Tax=Vagococcus sp. TaxID=1933889 RepID=UPI002FCC106C
MTSIRKGIIFLGYAFIFIYAVTFDSELGWLVFIFLTIFLLVNGLLLIDSLKNIQVTFAQELVSSVNEMKRVTLKVKSKNLNHRFYPLLSLKNEGLDLNQVIPLFYSKNKEISFDWLPQKRGYYESVEIEVRSSDFFGVLYKTHVQTVECSVCILPKQEKDISGLLHLIEPSIRKNLFGDTNFNLERLRVYQLGDSVKQIDWKTSSKKQQLILKEYETYQPTKTVFIFYGVKSFYFERMLSVYFSLFQQVESQFCRFVLMESEGKVIERPELEDFAKLEKNENPGKIPEVTESTILIFTPEKTKRLLKEIDTYDNQKIIQVIDFQMIEGEEVYAKN